MLVNGFTKFQIETGSRSIGVCFSKHYFIDLKWTDHKNVTSSDTQKKMVFISIVTDVKPCLGRTLFSGPVWFIHNVWNIFRSFLINCVWFADWNPVSACVPIGKCGITHHTFTMMRRERKRHKSYKGHGGKGKCKTNEWINGRFATEKANGNNKLTGNFERHFSPKDSLLSVVMVGSVYRNDAIKNTHPFDKPALQINHFTWTSRFPSLSQE